MKSVQLLAVAILASAGMAVTGRAQNLANEGDLILGFRNGTSGHVLELDLGPATAFDRTHSYNLTSGSYTGPSLNSNPGLLASDLTSVFGTSSWNTLGLNFGIAGGSGTGAAGILWVTQGSLVHGTIAAGSIGVPLNSVGTETSSFVGTFDFTSSGNAPVSSGDAFATDADVTSPANYVGAVRPSGLSNDYSFFNGFPTEGVVPSTGSVTLNLYKYAAGVAPVQQGFFTLSSAGALTYTAVPEPSTLTALIGGTAFLGLIRRRRAVVA